ncbi:hypothetical protein ABAC460_12830 [Asticcacaulis sp. AC460]|uniref:ROK family protein n=1 Tax=Asticcacaulis sp. AC460 TaxID=1282360 RepID=UPI0003C3CE17|nr:ROK family protein [Asticcacaulis sp. AC460]ESQ89389.1 hypothetical protein ABAC460_12830 [Asticcacaulis sp. AC460]
MSSRARSSPIKQLVGSNPARAGDYNQRVVLQTVRDRGTITTGDIATATGLSHQGAINITKRLLDDKLVIEDSKITGKRGQPASLYALNPDGAYALGLNVDREHVTLLVMNLAGQITHRVYRNISFPMPADILAFVQDEMNHLFAEEIVPRSRLIGLGIAIPDGLGVLVAESRPEALDAWTKADLTTLLSTSLKLPVYSQNDATAAAIGEHQLGQGERHRSFTYMLVSLGLGCGIIINDEPYTGGLNHAGEIGNIPLAQPSPQQKILWDAVSLHALYRELARDGITVDSPDQLDAGSAIQAPALERWLAAAVQHMKIPALTINYVLSPQISYIGGQLPAFLVERLCDRLNEVLQACETHTPITFYRPSTTGPDASALGAAFLVFRHQLLP